MTEIEERIASEIRLHGRVSFSRFMELALYCPVYGFYEREPDTIGRQGHFFTSVSVGPLFGQLLAFQFSKWIDNGLVATQSPLLIESGAHDGKLAGDILDWFEKHRPALYERLRYVIIEPSARRKAWQEAHLASRARKVSWVHDIEALDALNPAGVHAISFSNEFLDAFPVHRLSWNRVAQRWTEWGVSLSDSRFEWCPLATPADELGALLPQTVGAGLEHLPDGYVLEVSPEASQWWARAARMLSSGVLLTFDYGFSEEDRLSLARTGGTLRAYRRHQCSDNILEAPGEQDITAHVDFPALRRLGEAAGLQTRVFQTQGRYLAGLATQLAPDNTFAPPWDPSRTRQFATLTHPDHLGQVFKVLIQAKDSRIP